MKEFRTAAKTKLDEETGEPTVVTFKIDDTEYTATPPKSAAWMFLATAADDNNPMGNLVEMVKFLDAVLPEPQAKTLADRLRDPRDDFDIEDAADIFKYLISEFTGRPTESQPA